MNISESKYFRAQSITGPCAVYVSIRFGAGSEEKPIITKKISVGGPESEIKFDLENHISEVLTGVNLANSEMGGDLNVAEIEVVPSDNPSLGQVKSVAYKIAKHVIKNGT